MKPTTPNQPKEKLAYEKGYRVVNGEVLGKEVRARKLQTNTHGYYTVTIAAGSRTTNDRKVLNVSVHRLVAYQKFGEELFKEGVVVRHLDGNPKNNLEENITLGSHSDNMMDRPREVRNKLAINAASKKRVLTDVEVEEVREARRKGATFKQLVEMFNLSGKGQAHYIVNNNYVTRK